MRRTVSIILFLVLTSIAHAQPTPLPFPVKPGLIPAKLTVKASKLVSIDASAAKGKVKWRIDFSPDLAIIDGKKLVFASPFTGTYKILLLTVNDAGDIVDDSCEITVTDGVPMPTPDPNPPMPTDPVLAAIADLAKRITALENNKPAPIPVPVDAFQAAIQAAYVADGKQGAVVAQLAAIYRQSGATVNNPQAMKLSDILSAMHTAAQGLIADQLPTVRRVIGEELNANLGKTDMPLTPANRAAISVQFLRIQKALEGVK